MALFYSERLEFECFDGLKKIPYEQVNDDYCDCLDGSDEPGKIFSSQIFFINIFEIMF